MLESLRDIRLFVAVYEERSFTAAAARENATQSGVSQHIRKIEDRFGVKLFSREAGAVRPTPAGDGYYRRCIELLRLNEEASRTITRFGRGLEGQVNVGLMPTLTRCALAPSLATYMEENPNVAVRVTEGYSATLIQQTVAGELDFAVVPAFAGAVGLKIRLLGRTPEVFVSGGGLGVEHGMPIRLSQLGPLKIVVPGPLNVRRNTLETYFASHDVRIERMLELDAMLGTLGLIAQTDWVAVLPGVMMADGRPAGRYVVNPLFPALETELVLVEPARRSLSDAASAFLAILERTTAELSGIWAMPVPAGK